MKMLLLAGYLLAQTPEVPGCQEYRFESTGKETLQEVVGEFQKYLPFVTLEDLELENADTLGNSCSPQMLEQGTVLRYRVGCYLS